MSELNGKIISIQQHLKAPKNQFNSFGKYKYRSCEDILEGVKPLLHDAGLVQTITDEIINVGDRYYVKATVIVSHGENSVKVTAFAREPENKKGMDESQITGTASSYARKYALNGMWLIDDTKDADTDEHKNQVEKTKNPTLQIGTKKWIQAVDKVASGESTIDTVTKHFTIDENAFNAEVRQRQEDASA
jgi:hypothetical protein